ncbi:MAG: hypothetical protein Q8P40_01325 [Nitrospirota bacterium]|nr:hypothetical protein [Nitrospirota bacterium]
MNDAMKWFAKADLKKFESKWKVPRKDFLILNRWQKFSLLEIKY